jgi:hypothetical protein
MSLFDQLPRLSAYDPGAVGEGGLDPMGTAAVADRIANRLVPGLRARMSQPHFTTISAIGAFSCLSLRELTADEGRTTADIAFEWLVVESIVRSTVEGRRVGFPGTQKAARARAANQRLSRSTYLSGPRVFGFTGVHRPFSRDIAVLASDDSPAENAARLVHAWERDHDLPGYVDGIATQAGGRLRKEIADTCRRTLDKGECTAPVMGTLMPQLADCLAPAEVGVHERQVLNQLIRSGPHEIRNELSASLMDIDPPADVSQRDLALQLLPGASASTRQALKAAIDYETATTAIDNTFRRFLAHTTQQHGAVVSRAGALETPQLAELAPKVGDMAQRAMDSVSALGDEGLAVDAMRALQPFARHFTSGGFFDMLIERHEQVQHSRNKLSWIDRIDKDWIVRAPYRGQNDALDNSAWTHPMRLVTLARFLAVTA